jgi:hypothetical protein
MHGVPLVSALEITARYFYTTPPDRCIIAPLAVLEGFGGVCHRVLFSSEIPPACPAPVLRFLKAEMWEAGIMAWDHLLNASLSLCDCSENRNGWGRKNSE